MTISYSAARANVYHVWQQHPDWNHAELAAAVGSSKEWVKKWLKRFRQELAAGLAVEQILQGHSHVRKHLPTKTHPLGVQQVLSIRDQPAEGLRRVPGKVPIRSYLQRDPAWQVLQVPIPSCKTISRLLTSPKPHPRARKADSSAFGALRPSERLANRCALDVSSVPAERDGKQHHVVETLNIIDTGTSVLLDAHVRSDFTAETALEARARTLVKYGRPASIT
jgi:hypothetical protein